MELSQTYLKNYLIVAKCIKEHHTTRVNNDINSSITDLSYDHNSIAKSIAQHQKLSQRRKLEQSS